VLERLNLLFEFEDALVRFLVLCLGTLCAGNGVVGLLAQRCKTLRARWRVSVSLQVPDTILSSLPP
jgi:hypothetical protein